MRQNRSSELVYIGGNYFRYNDSSLCLKVIATLHQNDPRSSTNVSLSGVQFSIPFYHDLASCFLHNNRVRKLFLDGCNIGDEETHILAHMLRPNRALVVVSLQQNHIRSIGAGHLARVFGKERGGVDVEVPRTVLGRGVAG